VLVVVAVAVQTVPGLIHVHHTWTVAKIQELLVDTFQTLHTLAHFLRQALTHIQVMHVTAGNDIINPPRLLD
jgi:hypothetical protein